MEGAQGILIQGAQMSLLVPGAPEHIGHGDRGQNAGNAGLRRAGSDVLRIIITVILASETQIDGRVRQLFLQGGHHLTRKVARKTGAKKGCGLQTVFFGKGFSEAVLPFCGKSTVQDFPAREQHRVQDQAVRADFGQHRDQSLQIQIGIFPARKHQGPIIEIGPHITRTGQNPLGMFACKTVGFVSLSEVQIQRQNQLYLSVLPFQVLNLLFQGGKIRKDALKGVGSHRIRAVRHAALVNERSG